MAIAVRQRAFNGAASTTSVTCTFSMGTLAGSVVVAAANAGGSPTGLTITEGTDVYTDSPFGLVSTGLNVVTFVRIGMFANATTGTTTVTANTPGTSSFSEVVAWEITGLVSPSFDKTARNSQTTGAGTVGPSGTLSQNAEAAFAYFISQPGTTGTGQAAGWTDTLTSPNSNAMQDMITSLNTSLTATEGSSAAAPWDNFLWTIMPAVAVAKGGSLPLMGVG